MRCAYCHHCESKVTDSRSSPDGLAIRRRRECLACGRRFTTFETVDIVLQVSKRNGTYEDFQQQKLLKGILAASSHTSISHDQAKNLANTIVQELMERQLREISTRELGKIVMHKLQTLDQVAWIRFACVYKRFRDISEISAALESVQAEQHSYLPK